MAANTPQEMKSLIRQWFEQVWNRGDDGAIDRMLAPHAVAHGLSEGGQTWPGPEGFRKFYRKFRSAFSSIHISVEDAIAEGDRVAARFSFTGVHKGDGLGIAATGRTIRGTGMAITRWEDGQIVEAWNEVDFAGLMGTNHRSRCRARECKGLSDV